MTVATSSVSGLSAAAPVLQRWGHQSSLNDALAWALILLVALVPIPFGSNRPFFWALNATAVGLVGTVYLWRLGRRAEPLRRGLGSMWLSTTLYVLVGIWLALQVVPVGVLGPWADTVRPYLAAVTAQGVIVPLETVSVAPDATLLMLMRWATFGVFYILVLQLAASPRRRDLLLNAAVAITAIYAIFGLASLLQFGDTILGLKKWAYEGSATATFVNRNSFATFLAFGVVATLSAILGTFISQLEESGRAPGRLRIDPIVALYLVALIPIVGALLATQSRMGTMAALVGAVVVMLLGISRIPGLWLRSLLFVPLVSALLALAFYVYGQGLLDRLGSVESSADVRFDLYRQIVDMISARPWTGYGGGTFELAYPLFHRFPVSPDLVWDRAHNSYLGLFAELGLIAGTIVLLILALALFRVLGRIGHARLGWSARAAALGAILVGAIHSLSDFSLEMQANTFMFLLLVALGNSEDSRRRASAPETATAAARSRTEKA